MVVTALKAVLGSQIRTLRLARGLTQEKLAEQLEVTPRYFAGIERGERNLTLDSVDALAARLGVPAESLLVADEHRRVDGPLRADHTFVTDLVLDMDADVDTPARGQGPGSPHQDRQDLP